jgi:septum formation protein
VTLILASRSEARRRLLAAAGVTFEVVPPAVDEAALREALAAEATPAAEAATALADLKARRVATLVPPEAIVLGGDQLLELDDEWLEKPGDRDAAREQLRRLRGRVHVLASAVVGFRNGARVWQHVEIARLRMRPFTDGFLESYLDRAGGSVLGSIGAYQLEGLGAQLMAEVEGDHFTVQGLPLLAVLAFLRDQGVLER